ncbi:MAG: hypothetical protein ACR2HN_04760 [Tepidiformaceae bacterium]
MYGSWFFSMVTVIPVMFILLFAGYSAAVILGVTITQTLVRVPLSFMYSRGIWMFADDLLDPFLAWDGSTSEETVDGR